jgi:hypothetical protein
VKEAPYNSSLASAIEKEIGGKIIKISDRATLGLPDSWHIKDGVLTCIEAKIDDHYETDLDGEIFVQPWRVIKKQSDGLRQYEVCKSIARHCSVVYAIYYPKVRMSAILPIEIFDQFRPNEGEKTLPYLTNEAYLAHGKGIRQLKAIMASNRKEVYGRLSLGVS